MRECWDYGEDQTTQGKDGEWEEDIVQFVVLVGPALRTIVFGLFALCLTTIFATGFFLLCLWRNRLDVFIPTLREGIAIKAEDEDITYPEAFLEASERVFWIELRP